MESRKAKIFSTPIVLILVLVLATSNTTASSKSIPKRIPEETQTRIIRPLPKPRPPQIQIQVKSIHKNANNISIETEIPVHGSTITLNQNLKEIQIVCEARHPIKWEFLVNEASIPIYDVHYKRIFTPHQNALSSSADAKEILNQIENPAFNRFEGRVVFRKVLESQSGKYSCRFFNDRFSNNSYEKSANITVFIPGKRIFTTVSHTQYINASDDSMLISCPVSDPNLYSDVALQKLKSDHVTSNMRTQEWEQVTARFNPSVGFLVRKDENFQLAGTYKCIVFRRDVSITVRVVETGLNDSNLSPKTPDSCWNTPHCMELIRSLRLECFCKDSFALYANFNVNHQFEGTNVNRRGNCSSLESWWKRLSNLTGGDWRVEEFFRNGEEGQNVCFRDDIRRSFNGTGSRVILRIHKTPKLEDTKNSSLSSLVNFKVEFQGLPECASGFLLAVEYFPNSSLSTGNRTDENPNLDDIVVDKTHQRNRIYFLSQEPTSTQLFPLAHHQAVWDNILIDLRNVSRIHVFQPTSFSFQWFQISSTIANNNDSANTVTNTIHAQVNTRVQGDAQVCRDSEKTTNCESQEFSTMSGKYLAIAVIGVVSLLVIVTTLIYFHTRKQRLLVDERRKKLKSPQGFIPAFNNPNSMPNGVLCVRRSIPDPSDGDQNTE